MVTNRYFPHLHLGGTGSSLTAGPISLFSLIVSYLASVMYIRNASTTYTYYTALICTYQTRVPDYLRGICVPWTDNILL